MLSVAANGCTFPCRNLHQNQTTITFETSCLSESSRLWWTRLRDDSTGRLQLAHPGPKGLLGRPRAGVGWIGVSWGNTLQTHTLQGLWEQKQFVLFLLCIITKDTINGCLSHFQKLVVLTSIATRGGAEPWVAAHVLYLHQGCGRQQLAGLRSVWTARLELVITGLAVSVNQTDFPTTVVAPCVTNVAEFTECSYQHGGMLPLVQWTMVLRQCVKLHSNLGMHTTTTTTPGSLRLLTRQQHKLGKHSS